MCFTYGAGYPSLGGEENSAACLFFIYSDVLSAWLPKCSCYYRHDFVSRERVRVFVSLEIGLNALPPKQRCLAACQFFFIFSTLNAWVHVRRVRSPNCLCAGLQCSQRVSLLPLSRIPKFRRLAKTSLQRTICTK